MKERFEPEARKTIYQTRLQTRVKQKGEGWAEFGEDLLRLADKAYPELVDAAKEQFALNQYFTQLNNPQVAFAVKQTKPTTIDEAVRATLEMESYSKPMPSGITAVSEEGAVAISSVQGTSDLKMIMEKMERMETQLKEMQQSGSGSGRGRRITGRSGSRECWNCGGVGHISRNCSSPKRSQGNEQPPAR